MTAGRPTVMDKATVNKLEEAFALGCTDIEACFYAGISRQTLYTYQKDYPEFLDRKEALKEQPVLKARKVVLDAIAEGDKQSSQWYLERKQKAEFSVRQDIKADVTVNIVGDILKDMDGRSAGLPNDQE
jgi:hypothetical protein